MRFGVLAALAGCAGLACSHPPPTGEPLSYELSRVVTPDQLEIPETLPGFERVGIHVYDEPALGLQIRYRHDEPSDARLDLFVYPIALPELFSLADVLDATQQGLMSDVALAASTRGQTVGPVQVAAYTPRPGGLFPPGLRSDWELLRGAEAERSHAFVTVRHDLLFKLRMSYPNGEPGSATSRDLFEDFLEGLSQSIRSLEPDTREALHVVVTATTMEVAGNSACALSAWMGYGVALLHAVNEGQYLNTLQRETSARELAVKLWDNQSRESDSDCANPALEAQSAALAAGFLREYVWTEHRVEHWEAPGDLALGAYRSWAAENLPEHVPVFPGVLVRWSSDEDDESDGDGR